MAVSGVPHCLSGPCVWSVGCKEGLTIVTSATVQLTTLMWPQWTNMLKGQ